MSTTAQPSPGPAQSGPATSGPATSGPATPGAVRVRPRERVLRRFLAVAGAVVAALALWALAGPVAGIGPDVRLDGGVRPVGTGSVVAAGLLAGLAAWALLAVLERFTERPRRIWTICAIAVFALSLLSLPGPAVDAADLAALAGLHTIVAAVLIPGLGRTARR